MKNRKQLRITILLFLTIFLQSCAENKWSTTGISKYTYPNGATYTGTFDKSGFLNGQGTAIYENGDRYRGEFKYTMRHGEGIFIFKNGKKYTGQWKYGKEEGNGILSYINGNKYIGEWRDGKFDGDGIFKFNGNRYEGEFRKGIYDGKGTLTLANGKTYIGEWNNGRLIPITSPASTFPGITRHTIFSGVLNGVLVKMLFALIGL
jgi:hypothetical protein